MKCVFDENMPEKLAKTLNFLEGEHGIPVLHINQIVKPSTHDEDWIRLLGKEEKCFVITKDNKIKRNPAEIKAWEESNLTIVFLQDSWFNLKFWDICWKFIRLWPDLTESISKAQYQKKVMVHIKGRIEDMEVFPSRAEARAGSI
jgi:hypothetical protein